MLVWLPLAAELSETEGSLMGIVIVLLIVGTLVGGRFGTTRTEQPRSKVSSSLCPRLRRPWGGDTSRVPRWRQSKVTREGRRLPVDAGERRYALSDQAGRRRTARRPSRWVRFRHQAAATGLFIGHPWARREHRDLWAISVTMSHGIFRMVGLAPGAAKLMRFQAGIEDRLSKELVKAASGS